MSHRAEARYRGRAEGEPDPVAAALVCEHPVLTYHCSLARDRRHILDRMFETAPDDFYATDLEMAMRQKS